MSIYDLRSRDALAAARRFRANNLHSSGKKDTVHPKELIEEDSIIQEALSYVGGRLSFINKMCKAPRDGLVDCAKDLVAREKGWLLSQIGLIPDHDDDVMDEVR